MTHMSRHMHADLADDLYWSTKSLNIYVLCKLFELDHRREEKVCLIKKLSITMISINRRELTPAGEVSLCVSENFECPSIQRVTINVAHTTPRFICIP